MITQQSRLCSVSAQRSRVGYSVSAQRSRVDYSISAQRSRVDYSVSAQTSRVDYSVSAQRSRVDYSVSAQRSRVDPFCDPPLASNSAIGSKNGTLDDIRPACLRARRVQQCSPEGPDTILKLTLEKWKTGQDGTSTSSTTVLSRKGPIQSQSRE